MDDGGTAGIGAGVGTAGIGVGVGAAGGGVGGVARRVLGEVVGEGIFAVGGQAAVVRGGVLVADVAVGECGGGRALAAGHLHNVYCLAKPLPYLLLAGVVESAGCGADDLLGDVVSLPSWCPGGLTVRRLSCHGAGLGEPSGMAWRMAPPEERLGLLGRVKAGSGAYGGSAYSEIAGGLVAEHVIEQITGCQAARYCTEELLGPLELADDVVVDARTGLLARHRVRVPVSGLPVCGLPMLSELLPDQIGEIRLALGALATMRGMAGLFAAVGRVMGGHRVPGLLSPELLEDLLRDDRPLSYDPVLRRPAKWSGGLMVDLDQQGFSRLAGAGSVGHAGGLANSAALWDPTRKTSVAVYLNGVGADFLDQAVPRQHVLDSILDAIPPT